MAKLSKPTFYLAKNNDIKSEQKQGLLTTLIILHAVNNFIRFLQGIYWKEQHIMIGSAVSVAFIWNSVFFQ